MKTTEKNRYRNGWSRKIALRPVKVLLISLIFAAPFASGSKDATGAALPGNCYCESPDKLKSLVESQFKQLAADLWTEVTSLKNQLAALDSKGSSRSKRNADSSTVTCQMHDICRQYIKDHPDAPIQIETPKFQGIPTSCKDLQTIGYTLNGLYSVQTAGNAKEFQTVYCEFPPTSVISKQSSLPLNETRKGYIDMKTLSDGIHFYVQRSSPFVNSGKEAKVITYESSQLNSGGAMNVATGVFTAPVPGTYHFTFSGVNEDITSELYVSLRLNGLEKARSRVTYKSIQANTSTIVPTTTAPTTSTTTTTPTTTAVQVQQGAPQQGEPLQGEPLQGAPQQGAPQQGAVPQAGFDFGTLVNGVVGGVAGALGGGQQPNGKGGRQQTGGRGGGGGGGGGLLGMFGRKKRSMDSWMQASMNLGFQVTLKLNKDDKIDLCVINPGTLFDDNSHLTHFTGSLLDED